MQDRMNRGPVGVLDSGVGGLAVIRQVRKILPFEDYIFIADFEHAPYGSKPGDEIEHIVRSHVDNLILKGAKAVLLACNTATSAAAESLRRDIDIPVIGMEPAVKPATRYSNGASPIFVMATEATLRLSKFASLIKRYDDNEIIPLECPGLSIVIEQEGPGSKAVLSYLENLFKPHMQSLKGAAVVIGCTHYSFIEQDILKIAEVSIFDGRDGTAQQLARVLGERNILNQNGGSLVMYSTSDDIKYAELLERFNQLPLYDGR